jgi:hypothetical protein
MCYGRKVVGIVGDEEQDVDRLLPDVPHRLLHAWFQWLRR